MHADLKGALSQINRSWRAFEHNGNPMTKAQVKKVLEYGIAKGYEHTGQISDAEIDALLVSKEPIKPQHISELQKTLFCHD